MEASKRSHIQANLYTLVTATKCCQSFLNFFQKAGVFTPGNVSEIDNISEPLLKAALFYLRLIKSTSSYVHDVLIFALKQTRQDSPLVILTDQASKENKATQRSGIEANLYALMSETTCTLNFLNIFQEAGVLASAKAVEINNLSKNIQEPLLKPAMFYLHLIQSPSSRAYDVLLSALKKTEQEIPLRLLTDQTLLQHGYGTERPAETGSETAENNDPASPQPKRAKVTTNGKGKSGLAYPQTFTPSLSKKARKTLAKSEIHELMSNTLRLDTAQVSARIEKIKELLARKGPILSPRYEHEESPLLCDKVHPELLLFLLKSNRDSLCLYHPTVNGLNIVNKAACYLEADDFHKLVQHFVDAKEFHVVQHRASGLTALHRATFRMEVKEETIKLFETAGVGLNDVCRMGKSLLMYAVNRRKLSLAYLKRLVEMGSDPHLLNADGHSVVHLAARNGNVDAIRYFAGIGVDLRGKTEQELAVWNEVISHCSWTRLKAVVDTLRELGCEGGPFAEA